MKKLLIIMACAAAALPSFSVTNELVRPKGEQPDLDRPSREKSELGERKRKDRYREISPEMQEKIEERRLQLMEKTLKDIGVTEEQQAEILTLQARLKEDMKTNTRQVSEARKKLSTLQSEGAPQDAMFAAIDEIAAAQAEQMKLLVRNQVEMERILGKEKYKAFMESARSKWREHGRRGGSGMPPRPGLPPIPGQEGGGNQPPPPPPGS